MPPDHQPVGLDAAKGGGSPRPNENPAATDSRAPGRDEMRAGLSLPAAYDSLTPAHPTAQTNGRSGIALAQRLDAASKLSM